MSAINFFTGFFSYLNSLRPFKNIFITSFAAVSLYNHCLISNIFLCSCSYKFYLLFSCFCLFFLSDVPLHLLLLLLVLLSFPHHRVPMLSHWSLSDSKPPKVSRTLLSILADLNIAVVWIVSSRPLNSKSSSPFINPLVTVPREPITIGITITFMFRSFFNSSARSWY